MIIRLHTSSSTDRGDSLLLSKDYENAVRWYDRAIQENPNDPVLYNNQGLALQRLGKLHEALRCFNRATELDDKYLLPWINKGNVLSELRRYNEAMQCYDKAIEIDPNDASAWNNKGNLSAILGRYDEANTYFEKALQSLPEYASAWNNKGDALNHLGQYAEAKTCFEKALEVSAASNRIERELGYGNTTDISHESIAWNGIGYALAYLHESDEALKSFVKALEIDPRNALAWYNKAVHLVRVQEYEKAVQAYNEALKLDPNNATIWYSAGSSLQRLGKYSEALRSNIRAREINPNEVNAWFNEGNIYYELKRYHDAKRSFDKVLEISQADSQALYLRARCKNYLGYDLQEILSDLTKAIKSGGEQYRLMAREDAPFANIRDKDVFWKAIGMSNVDSESDTRAKAKRRILGEICKKYEETANPSFTLEYLQARLHGYDASYIDSNVRELLTSSDLIETDDNIGLKLSQKGIESCKRGDLLD